MRRVVIGLILIAVIASLCCAAHAKSVLITHKFKQGQADTYRMSIDMTMEMPQLQCGPDCVKMSIGATLKQKVLDVWEDGSARIETSYTNFKVKMVGVDQSQCQTIPDQTMVITLSSDRRVLGIEGMENFVANTQMPGFDFSQMATQMGYYGAFPQGPIEIGQSWRNTMPMPFGSGQMNVDSTLLAAALPVGKEVASKIKQDYEAYIDLSTLFDAVASSMQVSNQGSGMIQMNGGVDIDGWTVLYFSPERGRLVKANGKMEALMSLEMPAEAVAQGAPQQLNMKMNMALNIARL